MAHAESVRRSEVDDAIDAADRLTELADVADLMGDSDGADRFRRRATDARDRAMRLLDD